MDILNHMNVQPHGKLTAPKEKVDHREPGQQMNVQMKAFTETLKTAINFTDA